MSSSKVHSWKILCFGRGEGTAAQVEKYLHELGYKNAKVKSLSNDKSSDDEAIELLKETDWDAVSFGGGLTGYDDHIPREVTTLHWFNRLVNLVHEHAPKAKVIFVTGPQDIVDSFARILGPLETHPETA